MRRAIFLLALLAAGCREGVAPFTPEDPFGDHTSGQLTFNPRWDHTPAWNAGGDSVYYAAESYPGFPDTRGILLAAPRTGGTVRAILQPIQLGRSTAPWLAAPALAPDGRKIAIFELTGVDVQYPVVRCPAPPLVMFDTLGTGSILQEAVLRVRNIDSSSPNDDAKLTVKFAGRTFDPATQLTTNVAHPFHRLFEGEGVPIFRASWSPDGTRLVFSDGAGLHLWTVGQPAAVALPDTEDGIMPAWSPDGAWIAFSRPFRGTTQRFVCVGWFSANPGPGETPNIRFDRTVYTPLTRDGASLMLIRPDGTGLRSLGEGDGPTWTTDSRTVIAHRDENLYRISLENGAATLIPNTLFGYEPAISRDGRFLAFAKRREIGPGGVFEPLSKGNYDIWVAPF